MVSNLCFFYYQQHLTIMEIRIRSIEIQDQYSCINIIEYFWYSPFSNKIFFQHSSKIYLWWVCTYKIRLVGSRADQGEVERRFKESWVCVTEDKAKNHLEILLLRNSFGVCPADKAQNGASPFLSYSYLFPYLPLSSLSPHQTLLLNISFYACPSSSMYDDFNCCVFWPFFPFLKGPFFQLGS